MTLKTVTRHFLECWYKKDVQGNELIRFKTSDLSGTKLSYWYPFEEDKFTLLFKETPCQHGYGFLEVYCIKDNVKEISALVPLECTQSRLFQLPPESIFKG